MATLLLSAGLTFSYLLLRGEPWIDFAASLLSAVLVAMHVVAGWFWPRAGLLAGGIVLSVGITGAVLGFSPWVTPLELSVQSIVHFGVSSPVALVCCTAIASSAALRLRCAVRGSSDSVMGKG